MSAHYHAVVWIDHREARVFHFNASEVDKLVVHPDHPTRHLHHKANCMGSGHAAEDHDFLQQVAESIADAGVILITGPANAKTELLKHVEQHNPDLASRVAAVESVDHPSDRQLIDHARRYFRADHQAPLRMRR
jgi:stalled ribosome rescue protein Dom34